ncbi:site-2 protease family protein [Lysinibacillus sp. LZ02]|uniref:site-2 protease family protein n=1 Tax=Lysinibacillus sp. LZ02 TaxID=3420668 RepID=UPI003D369A83
MNKWLSPFYVTIALAIAFIASAFTSFAHTTNFFALSLGLFFMTIFIHELGHVVFGLFAGYRFMYMTIGPFTIEKSEKLKIVPNHSWAMFGGVAYCMPISTDHELTKKHMWYAAGGPLFSIGAAILLLGLWYLTDASILAYATTLHGAIFVATAVPMRMAGGFYSDGYIWLMLKRGGEKSQQYVAMLLLTKELMSPKKPSGWNKSLIENAKKMTPSADNIFAAYTVFYYELVTNGFKAASQAMDAFKTIPITNKNKILLQHLTHVRQIDSYVSDHPDAALIASLHAQLSKVEPISYKRSEALLASLQGDKELAEKRLQEVMEQCEQQMTQYGFFEAEKQLTAFLQQAVQVRNRSFTSEYMS